MMNINQNEKTNEVSVGGTLRKILTKNAGLRYCEHGHRHPTLHTTFNVFPKTHQEQKFLQTFLLFFFMFFVIRDADGV